MTRSTVLLLALLTTTAARGQAPPVIGGLVSLDEPAAPAAPAPAASPATAAAGPKVTARPLLGGIPIDPTAEEAQLISTAAYQCERATWRHMRPDLALALLRAEEEAGVGEGHVLRGVLLSAWCGEASYGVHDEVCRTGSCDGGAARGVLQLHAGYARMCLGLPYRGPATPEADALRDDPVRSARCFMSHVLRVLPRAERLGCRRSSPWVLAQVWVARGTPPACTTTSSHVDRLEGWRARR